MKDFAKSIVCNTKAEADKVGNFEDPKKAKYYIEMWERRRDDAKRSLQNAEGHLKEAMKHRYGDKEFNQREVQRYQEAVKAAEATIKQYDDLIKSAAKTSFSNTRTGNSNKAEIIEKKKKEGATLKVDNGQKLEFSDGSTYVKTSFSDDYREAHNYTGNSKVGNYKPDYKDVTDQELKNWIRMNEQDIREYTREAKKYEKFGSRPEFKGSYDASQYGHAIGEIEDRKEKIKWMQDELARRKHTGNKKVGNAAKTFSGKYIDIYDNGTVVVKEGWAFGERASVNTFERWLDSNIQAKEKVLKETKAMKEEFKKNFI